MSQTTKTATMTTREFRNPCLWEAVNGRVPARSPVWMMRQAGRYMPEYRALRQNFPSFLDFCKQPKTVTEVTMQPIEAFGMDAAILFSDILVLLPPMGLDLTFVEGKGPVISNPVRDAKGLKALRNPSLEELRYVFDSIGLIQKRLDREIPLLGFAGGPFTVASYMVEGGSSRELVQLKTLMFREPEIFRELMQQVTELTIAYLRGQCEAGADILVVMDSWAGFLAPTDYERYVLPHTRRIADDVRRAHPEVPLLHYANGGSTLLPHIADAGFQAIGLDWRADLETVLRDYPNTVFQGNMDPCRLLGSREGVVEEVARIKRLVGTRPHIFNLGHGILPMTPVENARAFIDAVHADPMH